MSFKIKDHYFHRAKKENYLARSVYKLKEIDERYRILKKGMKVLDLGHYPGSWSQYASQRVGEKGMVTSIDLKGPSRVLSHYENIKVIQGDIFAWRDLLSEEEKEEGLDVILSDMAPNTTGIKSVDQAKSLELVQEVFHLSRFLLKKRGSLVCKIFEGPDTRSLIQSEREHFRAIHLLRPQSTRKTSKEFFLTALEKNDLRVKEEEKDKKLKTDSFSHQHL